MHPLLPELLNTDAVIHTLHELNQRSHLQKGDSSIAPNYWGLEAESTVLHNNTDWEELCADHFIVGSVV